MDGWALAVDIGAAAVVAAVSDHDRIEIVEFAGRQALPPVVFFGPGQPPLVGLCAAGRAASEPDRAVLSPKRALADVDTVTVAGLDIPLTEVYASILKAVARQAAHGRAHATPEMLVLTHPALWGERELGILRAAAAAADLPDPVLIAEPMAAACCLAMDASPGQVFAVFDLDGDSIDAAVLRRTRDGFEFAGNPGSLPRLAGDDPEASLRRGVHELFATITHADLTPAELAAIHVVGVTSPNAPLTDLITQTLGVIPQIAASPTTTTVLGAAKSTAEAQPGQEPQEIHAAISDPTQSSAEGKRMPFTVSRNTFAGLVGIMVASSAVAAILLILPAGNAPPAKLKQLTGSQLAAALLPASALPSGYSDPASYSLGNGKMIVIYPRPGRLPSKNDCQGTMQPVISQLGQFLPEFAEATGFADAYSSANVTVDGARLFRQINQAVYQFANPSRAAAFFSLMRPCLLPSPATHLSTKPVDGNQAVTEVGSVTIRPSGENITIVPIFVLYQNDVLAVSETQNPSRPEISFVEADKLITNLIARVDAVSKRADGLGS